MSNVTKQFVLAGKAIFTVELPTDFAEKHKLKPYYTFRVDHKAAEGKWKEVWFVKYLTGPDNTSDYSYIGILNAESGEIRTSSKSKLPQSNIVFKLLSRTLALIWSGSVTPMEDHGFTLHHEGRCGKCGRLLTTPESVERGIGPECWSQMNDQRCDEPEENPTDIAEHEAVRNAYAQIDMT